VSEMDARRTRVMAHTCNGPILVEIDAYGGWRFRTADGAIGFIARCPRCGRRLLRRALRAVAPETVRGGGS
jgi:hypothetical protein